LIAAIEEGKPMLRLALAAMLFLTACATTPESGPTAQPSGAQTDKTETVTRAAGATAGILAWIGVMIVLPLAVLGAF